MVRKSKVLHLTTDDAPRDHYYLSVCKGKWSPEQGSADASCDWYVECGKAPFKAQREAKAHARRWPDHETNVIDLSSLKCVTTYRFSAMDGMTGSRDQDPAPF